MQLQHDDLEDGVRLVRLNGRLDLEGSEAVDLKLTSLCGTRKGFVVIDMSGVEFMSSIGVSVLVRVARACSQRQGRLVLLSPRANVQDVLVRTQIDQIIPIYADLPTARAGVMASA
jgi:anti-anti-sigma factor